MISQQPIIDRLKARGPKFTSIDGILEMARVSELSYAPPAGFVFPVADQARDNARVGAVRQPVTETFAVLFIVAGVARRTDAVQEAVHQYWEGVMKALLGWTHPDAQSETVYARSKMQYITAGEAACQMNFTCRQHITATITS